MAYAASSVQIALCLFSASSYAAGPDLAFVSLTGNAGRTYRVSVAEHKFRTEGVNRSYRNEIREAKEERGVSL